MYFVAGQKMTYNMCTILVVAIFLTTSQVVTGQPVYDTSFYNILQEPREGNFTFYDAKCRGELSFIIQWS